MGKPDFPSTFFSKERSILCRPSGTDSLKILNAKENVLTLEWSEDHLQWSVYVSENSSKWVAWFSSQVWAEVPAQCGINTESRMWIVVSGTMLLSFFKCLESIFILITVIITGVCVGA